jgi:hypothetical protein
MAGSARVGVRWRLGAKTRRSILLLHIASAGRPCERGARREH